MTFRARQPGCPCCEDCICFQFADLIEGKLQYTEISGEWDIVEGEFVNRLATKDDNAVILYDETPVDAREYLFRTTSDQSRNFNDQRRTYFSYKDADNHLYAAVTLEPRPDLGLTLVQVNVALVSVVGGTVTEHGTTSFIAGAGGSSNAVLCRVRVSLTICVTESSGPYGDALDVSVWTADGGVIDATVDAETLGNFLGYGNATATTPHENETTQWSQLVLYYNNVQCGFCGSRLCDEISQQLELELIGIRDRDCDCEELTKDTILMADLLRPRPLTAMEWRYSGELPGCEPNELRIQIGLSRVPPDQLLLQTGYNLSVGVIVFFPSASSGVAVLSYSQDFGYSECKRMNCIELLTDIDIELTKEESLSPREECYWTQQDSPLVKCRLKINAVVP